MHVCFSLWQCVHFFIMSMPWRALEVRVVLWGIGQHHVMLSTGQACSAFSLSMARTSLRTSTMPWLWWPSPFRSSLRRRISQSLLEAVLAIQTSGRLAHSSNGEARDERWLAFASFPTNHPFAVMHYHTLPLVWHWQEWKLSHHKDWNRKHFASKTMPLLLKRSNNRVQGHIKPVKLLITLALWNLVVPICIWDPIWDPYRCHFCSPMSVPAHYVPSVSTPHDTP